MPPSIPSTVVQRFLSGAARLTTFFDFIIWTKSFLSVTLGKYLPASQPLNYAALLRSEGSLSINVVWETKTESHRAGECARSVHQTGAIECTKMVLSGHDSSVYATVHRRQEIPSLIVSRA
jgi:hypothetical protein